MEYLGVRNNVNSFCLVKLHYKLEECINRMEFYIFAYITIRSILRYVPSNHIPDVSLTFPAV